MSTSPIPLPNPPYYPGEIQTTPFLGLSLVGLGQTLAENMVALDNFAANTVTSIFGRTGVVTPMTNDYDFSNLSGIISLGQFPIPDGGGDDCFCRGDGNWSPMCNGPFSANSLIILESISPTSGATAGTTGQIAWDANNIYVCTVGGDAGFATWKAAALSAV